MYIDDIRLFTKNENELETLIQALRIHGQDIWMEFGIEKCAMLIIRSRKWYKKEGMEQPNQEKIRMFGEKATYKYLGILEANTIEQEDMKGKKLKKSISGEGGSYSKPNYIAGISSKG